MLDKHLAFQFLNTYLGCGLAMRMGCICVFHFLSVAMPFDRETVVIQMITLDNSIGFSH